MRVEKLKRSRKSKKRWRFFLLLALLLSAFYYYLEGGRSDPPAWWKLPSFWPRASGPVKWRIKAPVLKARGRLPELSWAELWRYFRDLPGDAESSGFVTLARHTDDPQCPSLWTTPAGDIWGRSTDEEILEFLITEEMIDRAYQNATVAVEPGDTVIDVGGHLGVFTRFAFERGARRVVVIEPEPVNLACLKKTFAREIADGSVLLVAAAAWDTPGTLSFAVEGNGNTGSSHVGEGTVFSAAEIEVEAVTIDQVVADLGLDRIDFIKMDIEGAERHALAGAKETLARFGPRLALCVYHNPDDREVLPKIVLDARPEYHVELASNMAYVY